MYRPITYIKMKSSIKREGFKLFKWFVNKTGFIDNPDKVANRMLLIIGLIVSVLWLSSSYVTIHPLYPLATTLVGMVGIILMLAIMILTSVFRVGSNSRFIRSLDDSQMTLDQFKNLDD